MTKERVNISIDKDLMEKARKQIPNLSAFIEECLKYYLGLEDGLMPIIKDQDILDEIGRLQAKLYMNKQNFNIEESIKQAEQFEKDKAWRFLWNDYRVRKIPDEQLLAEAVEKLGVDEETLDDLLDEVFEVREQINTEEWDTVKKWYEAMINGD